MSSDFDGKITKPVKPFRLENMTLVAATAIAVLIAAMVAVVTYLA